MRIHVLVAALFLWPCVGFAQESTAEEESVVVEDEASSEGEVSPKKEDAPSEGEAPTKKEAKSKPKDDASKEDKPEQDPVSGDEASEDDVIIIVDDPDPVAVAESEPAEDESGAEETLIIVDEADESGEQTLIIMEDDGPDDTLVIDDTPKPSGSVSKPTRSLERTWLKGEFKSRLMVDTVFDPTGEDVVEWWDMLRLSIDHRTSSGVKFYADTWVRWGYTAEHADAGDAFYFFNAGDPKWTGNVQLREGFITWSPGDFDLKIGQRVFVWGKNEFMAAANVLNPPDLRFDITSNLDSTKDGRVPVFALDGTWWLGETGFQLVVVPFFERTKGYLMGRDFALAPPGSPLESQLKQALTLHPSVEDQLQDGFLGTEVPDESPLNSTLALRIKTKQWGWDFALTAIYGWDQTPDVYIDPDLRVMLLSGQLNINNPQVAATDPVVNQAALAVQQKAAIGQELLRAIYHRKLTVAGELQGVIGPFVARLDLGFSPESTQYTTSLDVIRKPSMTTAGGLEYTYGDAWYVQLTGFGNMVFDLEEGVTLSGIDKAPEPDEVVAARPVAAMYGVSAALRWTWVEESIEVSLGGLWNISPGDFVANARISYFDWDPHTFRLGAILVDGPSGTLGRNYGGNDFVYLEYAASF